MGTKPTRGPASPMPSHSAMMANKLSKEIEKGNKDMQLNKICFSIDNNTNVHETAKFLRLMDTQRALNNMQGTIVLCIGSYDGLLEPSYIVNEKDFYDIVEPSGYVNTQDCVLEIPGDTRQPCTLKFYDGATYSVGPMKRVTKEEAASLRSWTYVQATEQYFATTGEL